MKPKTQTTDEDDLSQRELILRHLRKFGTITPMEALEYYGCFRLSARIYELRDSYTIITRDDENDYATYILQEGNT